MAGPFDALRRRLRSKDASTSIDELSAALGDDEVAYALSYLAQHTGAATLGALLDDEETARLFRRSLAPTVQEQVLRALDEWRAAPVRLALRWRIAPSPNALTPPERGPELRAWIAEHRVEGYLGALAQKARPFAPSGLFLDTRELVTIEDLIERRGFVATLAAGTAERYAAAARAYLHYRATRQLVHDRRKKLWRRRPECKALRTVAARLHDQLRRMAPGAEDPVFLAGDEHLVVREGPPAMEVELRKRPRARVRLDFLGFESGPVTLSTDRRVPSAEAPEVRALLEWTLDAVHDRRHPLHATLAHVLRRPTWVFLVDAIAGDLDRRRDEPSNQRLSWRLEGESDALRVQAVIQRRGKRGRWSKGARTAPANVPAELIGPLDRDVLRALTEGGEPSPLEHDPALAALVGHPRVERDGVRVRVRKEVPTLALVPAGGGVRCEVRLGERVLSRRSIERRKLHVARVDDDYLLTRLDPEIRRVATSLAAFPGVLPPESFDRVLGLLSRLQPRVRLRLPTALRGTLVPAPERLVVRLEPDEDTLAVELLCRPFGEHGPAWRAGEGPAVVYGAIEGERVHTLRDLEAERQQARRLQDALDLEGLTHREAELQRALEILDELERRAAGGELVTEWPQGRRWRLLGAADAQALKLRVKRAGDWFGVSGEVSVGGKAVALAALLDATRRGERWVRVAPGRFARIADDLRKRLEKADEVLATEKGALVAGLAAVADVASIVGEGALEPDEEWRALIARLEEARALDPTPPEGLHAALRSYQREGFRWMARLAQWGAGAVLADEMGLGKTVQALAMLVHREHEGPALVVAPTSVGSIWEQEAARFAPSLRVVPYRGPKRVGLLAELGPGDVVVTSYDILARDAEALGEQTWGTLVLDEAQAIKNARTKRAKAAAQLKASWRLALTGTPLENHLGELWSLMRVISPGLLGSWAHFRARYALPIERDGDEARREALARKLRPFLLRRTKSAVAQELPSRTEVVRPVELSAAEREVYEAARREAIEGLLESGKRMQVLAAMTRLRLLACHPRLVDRTSTLPSAKMNSLLELLDELRADGHRTLVFSQFVSLLEIVRDTLDMRGVDPLYLVGSTPAAQRARLVERWQSGDDPVFLISLKAGGTGLTLTGADTVVHLDPWWNPSVEDQASDRVHRIGQDKPVTIVRLVAQGTIEETVLRLHADKRNLVDGVLRGAGAAGALSAEELLALIRGDGEVVQAAAE